MSLGLQKTLSFLLLIIIGLVLKKKISSKEELKGIKTLILSIALPATIFVALLKIEIKPSLILLPILALAVNGLLFLGAKLLLPRMGIDKQSPRYRTLLLLIPSFAPGLSCFPFLTEYLGEENLALAALADVGNKIFVLILLYLLAMHWYYQLNKQSQSANPSSNKRLKELGLSLLREPINMIMLLAIVMLGLGFNLQSLPYFLQDSISRMSLLMTPMVLIFIGLAVKLKKGDVLLLLQVLFWRSGLAFLLSAFLLSVLPAHIAGPTLLVAVVFPQSACSFWPFAHMTAIRSMEEKSSRTTSTFDLDLGLNLLAFSLPFSTMIILGICSFGPLFAKPGLLILLGLAMIVVGNLPLLAKKKKTKPEFQKTIA